MFLRVPRELMAYVPAAVARMGYLHPNHSFAISDDGITVAGVMEDTDRTNISRDLYYAIYREKILDDAKPLRESMLSMLGRNS